MLFGADCGLALRGNRAGRGDEVGQVSVEEVGVDEQLAQPLRKFELCARAGRQFGDRRDICTRVCRLGAPRHVRRWRVSEWGWDHCWCEERRWPVLEVLPSRTTTVATPQGAREQCAWLLGDIRNYHSRNEVTVLTTSTKEQD